MPTVTSISTGKDKLRYLESKCAELGMQLNLANRQCQELKEKLKHLENIIVKSADVLRIK
jgi:hypothetical protein